MNDSFFEYFIRERENISQNLYGDSGVRYKEYARFPRTALPDPRELEVSLSRLLAHRHTTRDFSTEQISLADFGTLLHWVIGEVGERPDAPNGGKNRPYPSGGAKYPIELYPIVLNVEGVTPGVYHYHVPSHALEQISDTVDPKVLGAPLFYDFVQGAAAVLCLTFMKSRSVKKYGGLAYKLGMLEAGHVGQNAYLAAEALGLGCCGLGGGDQPLMYSLLEIDGGNEHVVYAVAVGKKK